MVRIAARRTPDSILFRWENTADVQPATTLEVLSDELGLSDANGSVRTSFRISDLARQKLSELAERSGLSMREQIDLIALDLFHDNEDLRSVLDEFIRRDRVPADSRRRSQTLSAVARKLIERKAADMELSRDQVLQQAILFRAAVEKYSDEHAGEVSSAATELTRVVAVAVRTAHQLDATYGPGHWLTIEFNRVLESLRRLADSPQAHGAPSVRAVSPSRSRAA